MALYPPITLVTDIVTTTPGDDEVVCKLPDAQRQMKLFLSTWLLQAHNADGTIKAGAVPASAFASGAIVGATSSTVAKDIAAGTVMAVNLASDSVETAKIKNDAVTNDKILAGTIAATKLAGGITGTQLAATTVATANIALLAVDTPQIKDDAVTADKLAAGAVVLASIADNIITPVKLANPGPATTSNPYLPVIAGTASVGSKAAAIGGVLTATLGTVGGIDTLIFANSVLGSTISFGLIEERATGGLTAVNPADAIATWNQRGGWTGVTGTDTVFAIASPNLITIKVAGSYLIYFECQAYSVGAHQAMLATYAAPAYTVTTCIGNRAYAPPGQQSSSNYFGILSVPADNTIYAIQHWAELTQAGNGKGLDVGSSAENHPVYARFACIKL